jgi:[ribosomal protein S18]-alanine N-acetyltransferase
LAEPSFHVRECVEGDLDEILAIEDESFTDPYDREIFIQLLRTEPGGFLVAAAGHRLVGYVASSAKYGLILSLAVSPERRRRGVGAALMESALLYLRGRTARVTLQVRVSNSAAIALYRRFSFREDGRLRRYYPDGEDALVMSLGLGSR